MFARALTTTALLAGALLAAVALVAAPGTALSGAACGTVVGALRWKWVHDNTGGTATARAGSRAGAVVGAGITGGALVLTGLVVLLGSAAGPAVLLVLLALTFSAWWRRRPASGAAPRPTPWGATRHRPARGARRLDAPERATPLPAAVVPAVWVPSSAPIPANLSTPQLCLAWQRSYFALLDLPVGAPGGEIVGLRERLLDEIERRDPAGFTRWLDTGARAGSDPGRYLAGDR